MKIRFVARSLLLALTLTLIGGPPVLVAPAFAAAPAPTGPVNINTADVNALMTLSGVGQKVAERIVQYRDNNGPFKHPEDLRKVQGIGAGLWERNRERIVIK
jgi:competence protein ComEA